jgi:hypothetical protein
MYLAEQLDPSLSVLPNQLSSHNVGGQRKRWRPLLTEIPSELDLSIENVEKMGSNLQ